MLIRPSVTDTTGGRQEPFADGEDPRGAPGARPLLPGTRTLTLRRAVQNGAWTFIPGLFFLLFFVIPLLTARPNWQEVVVALGLVVVVALAYLGTTLAADLPLVGRWAYAIGFAVLQTGALFPFAGAFVFAMGAYLTIMLAWLIPWTQARIAILVWTVISLVVGIADHGNWYVILLSMIAGGVGLIMGAGIESGRLHRRLKNAEQRIATLAVAAERERIARDLHDILGHSLTAITVKAELAARLVDKDAVAAREQMREVETVARQALSDVRATTSGFRKVRLAGEIASARSVLMAAGIDCTAPVALEPMPDQSNEFFGWCVREGVTNVVRHSRASRCVITATATVVTISDDGVGLDPELACDGSGLVGLRARGDQLGARVQAQAVTPHGTVLSARLDGAGR